MKQNKYLLMSHKVGSLHNFIDYVYNNWLTKYDLKPNIYICISLITAIDMSKSMIRYYSSIDSNNNNNNNNNALLWISQHL